MRRRWRLILPILGLLLFGFGSYVSFRTERVNPLPSNRYFWWASIRLDRDPLGRPSSLPAPQQNEDGSITWDPVTRWVTPGPLAMFLMISAIPAFAVGAIAVGGLGRLGISQVSSFMVLMPLLISAWYYAVGLLIDRWIGRHQLQAPTANSERRTTSDSAPSAPTPASPSAD